MSIKITIPNSSSDVLTFGSGNTPTAAQIAGIDSGSSNGQLALYTTASGTSTEAVRITAAQNVGIGTSSPGSRLDIQAAQVTVTATSTTGTNATFFRANNTGGYFFAGRDNSTGSSFGSAYASVLWSNGAYPMLFATNDVERMRIDSSGNLLVGTTSSTETVFGARITGADGRFISTKPETTNSASTFVVYSTGAAAYRFYVGMGGTVFATSTTISAISDIRYKENIRDLDVGLDKIMALKPRLYDWKEGKGSDIKNARGFIAQEFEQVFPDLIDEWADPAPEGEEPYKSVRADLIPVLVKAIQEQQALITQLQADVAALKGASA